MKCPQCKQDIKFIKKFGKCSECAADDKGLVKVGNHYVPWAYHNYLDDDGTETPYEKYNADINASFPKIKWNDDKNKFQVIFSGADFRGYDNQEFVWYFDSIEDIFDEMTKE